MAKKYFGDENPLEKLLVIGNDKKTFKVTGVAANLSVQFAFYFNVLISGASDNDLKQNVWLNNGIVTYFTLREKYQCQNGRSNFENW